MISRFEYPQMTESRLWNNLLIVQTWILLLDFLASSYVFFLNSSRTPDFGFFLICVIQILVIVILIPLHKLHGEYQLQSLEKKLQFSRKTNVKSPLGAEVTDDNVEFEKIVSIDEIKNNFRNLTLYILSFDFVISSVLWLYGQFQNQIYIHYWVYSNQVYFLSLILVLRLYMTMRINSVQMNNLTIRSKHAGHAPPDVRKPKSFISRFLLAPPKEQVILSIAVLLLILTPIGFHTTTVVEDDFSYQIDLSAATRYEAFEPLYSEYDDGKLDVIGIGYISASIGTHVHRFISHISYSTTGGFGLLGVTEITQIGRTNDTVIHSSGKDGHFYLTLWNWNSWNYSTYHYDVAAESYTQLETLHVDRDSHNGELLYRKHQIFSVPTETGVFVVNSTHSGYEELTEIRYYTNNSQQSIFTFDKTVIDGIEVNGQIHWLHYNLDNPNYFAVSSASLSNGTFVSTELITIALDAVSQSEIYPEIGRSTPNGASLFTQNDQLYYRSLLNLYDISNFQSKSMSAITGGPSPIEYRKLDGNVVTDTHVILSEGAEIKFYNIDSLSESISAKALNARYVGNDEIELVVIEDGLVSFAEFRTRVSNKQKVDSNIYVWPDKIQDLEEHAQYRMTIIASTIVVNLIVSAFVASRLQRFKE